MASAGSNVRLSLVGITGTTAEILYTIDTTGRYEDGYLIVFNENNTEVSRTSSFRVYGNSSGSQNVTGIASGHLYTVKFYSSDLGVYSESTVEIDLRSGDPAYAVSSSSTATSINIIVSPISSATMEADGTVVVESVSDGIKESVGYTSSDSSASITLVGLDQNTEYAFSVTYYDPGLATTTVRTVTIDTAELDPKIVPRLYGEVENKTQLVDRMYGEVSNEARRVNRLYGPGEKTVFDELQLKGDTYQQTYSGKNLLKPYQNPSNPLSVNGLTAMLHSNGTIEVNGTATKNTWFEFVYDFKSGTEAQTNPTIILGSSNTYTVSLAKEGVATGDITLFIQYDASGSQKDVSVDGNASFTESPGIYRGYLRFLTGASCTNAIFYPMIELGSTATDFEPYVGGIPSPNPDYPQTVQTVTGAQTVEVTGKSLIDLGTGVYTDNGFKWTRTSNTIVGSGKWGVSRQYGAMLDSTTIPLSKPLPAGTYTLSCEPPEGHILELSLYNSEDTRIFNGHTTSSVHYITFTLTETATGIRLYAQGMVTNTTYNLTYGNIQIEAGSTPTTYEPYQSQSYPISLGSTELCKIGDYQDYIYKSGDDWYVHKEVEKVVLSGNENVGVNSAGTTNWYYAITNGYDNAAANAVISSHYIYNGSIAASNTIQGASITSGGTIRVRFGTEDTAANYKTWLTSNNVTIYYALATPTDTKITDNTLIGELEALRRGALGDGSSVEVEGELPAIISYDSISNYAKLIHVDRKKIPIFGEVTYYDSNNRLVTEVLKSQSEVNSFAGVSSDWSGTANGVTISNGSIHSIRLYSLTTSIPEWFLSSCDNMTNVDMAGASVTSIPNRFMVGCTSITDGNSVVLPSSLTSIGDNFMYGCNGLTSAPAFPDSLTTIGRTFMNDCTNMTLVVFPASLTSIGQEMLSVCDRLESVYVGNLSADIAAADSSGTYSFSVLTSGASAYVNGIKILGDSSIIDGWLTKFPNRSSTPFRKIVPDSAYGAITYYKDSNHTMTDTEFIYDQTDVNKLVGNGQLTWSATINDKTINSLDIKEVDISGCTSLTTTPVNFLQYCRNLDSISIPSSLTSIGTGFLAYCTSFNQQIILPTGISAIGNTFLYNCIAFNQPIDIPDTVTSIGVTFLGGCVAFNQDLTIPSSVITIGQNFMMVCDSMVKTITCNAPAPIVGTPVNLNLTGSSPNAQCYVSGIKLSGSYASSWHSANPDSSSNSIYRKTIVV